MRKTKETQKPFLITVVTSGWGMATGHEVDTDKMKDGIGYSKSHECRCNPPVAIPDTAAEKDVGNNGKNGTHISQYW